MKSITQSCSVCGDKHTCTMCQAEAERTKRPAPNGVVRAREEREAEHER